MTEVLKLTSFMAHRQTYALTVASIKGGKVGTEGGRERERERECMHVHVMCVRACVCVCACGFYKRGWGGEV